MPLPGIAGGESGQGTGRGADGEPGVGPPGDPGGDAAGALAGEPFPLGGVALEAADDLEARRAVYDSLYTWWQNECYSPVVLPMQIDILNEAYSFLRRADAVKRDPGVSATIRDLLELQIQRVSFVITDYFRARSRKLTENPHMYSEASWSEVLTPNELEFVAGLRGLVEESLEEQVFSRIAVRGRRDFRVGSTAYSLVELYKKKLYSSLIAQRAQIENSFVIFQAISPCEITVNEDRMYLSEGAQYVVQFGVVKDLVLSGTGRLVG